MILDKELSALAMVIVVKLVRRVTKSIANKRRTERGTHFQDLSLSHLRSARNTIVTVCACTLMSRAVVAKVQLQVQGAIFLAAAAVCNAAISRVVVEQEEERHVRDILEIEALLDDNINMLVAQEEKYEEAMSQDNEHIDESRSQSSQESDTDSDSDTGTWPSTPTWGRAVPGLKNVPTCNSTPWTQPMQPLSQAGTPLSPPRTVSSNLTGRHASPGASPTVTFASITLKDNKEDKSPVQEHEHPQESNSEYSQESGSHSGSDSDSDSDALFPSPTWGRAMPGLKNVPTRGSTPWSQPLQSPPQASSHPPSPGAVSGNFSVEPAIPGAFPAVTGKVTVGLASATSRDNKEDQENKSPSSIGARGRKGSVLPHTKGPVVEDARKGVHNPVLTLPMPARMPFSPLEAEPKRAYLSADDTVAQVLQRVEEQLMRMTNRLDSDPSDNRITELEEEMGELHNLLAQETSKTMTAALLDTGNMMGERYVSMIHLLGRDFSASKYHSRKTLFQAPFRVVCACEQTADTELVIKIADIDTGGANICSRATTLNEVWVMTKLAWVPGMCRLVDYGMDQDHTYLVMPRYNGSLRQWRLEQANPTPSNQRHYLNLFLQAIHHVKALHSEQIVHFDLKCDNFLLEGLSGVSKGTELPFSLVLADFGSAMDLSFCQDKRTQRARGTECIQPPEMLLMGRRGQENASGCAAPADVWALGCLLYELVTGTMLYDSNDFARFYLNLTQDSRELLLPERMEPIAHLPQIQEILTFILVRDPQERPTLDQVADRVQAALDTPTHLSKADGKQSQPVLPSLPPVRALLPARPALPTRRKTQDPRPRPKATTVQQEPVMPRVPECNVPAAHGPSVSPEAGMPDGDIAPEVVPARPEKKKRGWLKKFGKGLAVAGAAVGAGLLLRR